MCDVLSFVQVYLSVRLVRMRKRSVDSKMEKKLNFLLVGKTGYGKSATGNSILDRKVFESSARATSTTKDVDYSFAHFDGYVLKVVDGPGLQDTDINDASDEKTKVRKIAEDREKVAKHMDKALAMCYEGVDAFLFVIKFGNRFTDEDKETLQVLKLIFGERYLDHVVVVMTGGDLFYKDMEHDGTDMTFHEWCNQQKGEFQKLYKDIEGRVVLFNNRETDEVQKKSQIRELVKLAEDFQFRFGRYNSECFQNAKSERDKMILTLKAPQLIEEIQEKLSLLSASIEKFATKPSSDFQSTLEKQIYDLKKEIESQDKNYGVLDDLKELVEKVEMNLNNTVELQRLGKEIENTRKAKSVWAALGTVCTIVGTAIALAAGPAVGAVVFTISATMTALGFGAAQGKQNKNENKKKAIENEMKK